MKVDTYLFGSVEVAPEKVITFPKGMISFENNTRFMLVHENEKGSPESFTLQSLDDPLLAFQIMDPTTIGFNYDLSLTEEENALLGSPAPEDVAVMVLLFKQEEENAPIAPSLRAPLLINTKARIGLQKMMEVFRPNITLTNMATAV